MFRETPIVEIAFKYIEVINTFQVRWDKFHILVPFWNISVLTPQVLNRLCLSEVILKDMGQIYK